MLKIVKLSSIILCALSLGAFADHHEGHGMKHKHGIEMNGTLDMFYTHNTNGTDGAATPFNGVASNSTADHDDLGINMAQLTLSGGAHKVDWFLDFVYGDFTTQYSNNNVGPLAQAYLTYNVNNNLSVTAGRMATNVGFEGSYAKDNWNYSRSYAFGNAGPFFHEGIAVKYSHDSGFGAGLFYYDSENEGNDTNSAHATSAQLSYGMSNWAVVYNYYTNKTTKRDIHNLNATFDLNDHWNFAASYIVNTDESDNGTAETNSISLYARYKCKRWYGAFRAEQFDADQDTLNDKILGLTATAGYMLNDMSEVRLEVRQDSADKTTPFPKADSATNEDSQTTVTAAWITRF